MDTSYPLTVENCPLDEDMAITAIDVDERHRFRMLELGLRAGTVIRVVQRANFGGRVVARGTERIALDGRTASRITVAPAAG
ncbi:Ferrous iron transport protein A [Bifidobacterium italicum]|uniref:Ferrous iron transport protein A n=1 Tax=Bifidobacterium italicum TaxID=1960968 RepID=A0A2A2EJM0_9BIFI|nr:FeoA family protein [Bifidobacterium italicum]PAU69182.1 Ferrous iron transport protein A [Bifidobacterium italicum]